MAKHKFEGYETHAEFEYRLKVFRENYKKIVDHNRQDEVPFTLEINLFADLTEEEFLKTYADGIRVPESIRQSRQDEIGARNL